jgi:hypothetical protein
MHTAKYMQQNAYSKIHAAKYMQQNACSKMHTAKYMQQNTCSMLTNLLVAYLSTRCIPACFLHTATYAYSSRLRINRLCHGSQDCSLSTACKARRYIIKKIIIKIKVFKNKHIEKK